MDRQREKVWSPSQMVPMVTHVRRVYFRERGIYTRISAESAQFDCPPTIQVYREAGGKGRHS